MSFFLRKHKSLIEFEYSMRLFRQLLTIGAGLEREVFDGEYDVSRPADADIEGRCSISQTRLESDETSHHTRWPFRIASPQLAFVHCTTCPVWHRRRSASCSCFFANLFFAAAFSFGMNQLDAKAVTHTKEGRAS